MKKNSVFLLIVVHSRREIIQPDITSVTLCLYLAQNFSYLNALTMISPNTPNRNHKVVGSLTKSGMKTSSADQTRVSQRWNCGRRVKAASWTWVSPHPSTSCLAIASFETWALPTPPHPTHFHVLTLPSTTLFKLPNSHHLYPYLRIILCEPNS